MLSYNKTNYIYQIYSWNETLHVLDSFSVHHQEFFTVHTAMVYVIQVCWQLASRIRMFHSKNKFEKLVHLVGFIIRNLSWCAVTWTSKSVCFLFPCSTDTINTCWHEYSGLLGCNSASLGEKFLFFPHGPWKRRHYNASECLQLLT